MHRRLLFLVAIIALVATPVWAAPLDVGNARRVSLDADWRFLKGDAAGAEQPGFDDHAWRALDVPHDWAIEGPFDKSLDPQTGALPYAGSRLVPQALHARRRRARPTPRSALRRRDGERARLAQRARDGLASVRLHQLRRRPHAVPGVRAAGQRAGRAPRAGARVVALVSRRRDLPSRLARRHRPGPRAALGHVRHDTVGGRRVGARERQGRNRQRDGGRRVGDGRNRDRRRRRRRGRPRHAHAGHRGGRVVGVRREHADDPAARALGPRAARISIAPSPSCGRGRTCSIATSRRSASARSPSTRPRASRSTDGT